jgi:SWI/SNF-related matrix-associated actin-dependent regulator 1 of chromatin subfamily A
VQAIAVSCHYSDDWPVLVICPSSLRLNWQDEFMRWVPGMGKHRVHVILKGKDGVFPNEMRRSTDVVIVSYDLVTKLLADLQKAKFGVIICDESHFLKNHKAKRTEACLSLLQPAKYIVMLTGTPALSRPIELHTQVEALRPGLLGSRTDYGIKFCGARKARFGGMEYKGATHMGELHMLLKQYCMIRRKKEDVLTQLPDKTRGAVVLETGSRACKKIAEMIKDVKKQKGGANDEDELSMLQNQEQGLMAEAYKETGLAKIEPVQAYITDLIEGGAKFLIFAHHGAVLDAIETAVQKCKVDYFRLDGKTPMKQRQADVNRFQQNETCRVAVLSITAGGTGLTLTAASMVVFAELYWTPAQMLQAEDRVHRIGQANAVTITYLLGKDTLDDVIWPMINSKLQVLGKLAHCAA